MDPMAAYFAMMAAAMGRSMMPPGVSQHIELLDIVRKAYLKRQFPTPSVDMMPQMPHGQPPVPAGPANMHPVDPLAANVKMEPGTEPTEPPAPPPPAAGPQSSVPEGTPVIDDKEVTIYKVFLASLERDAEQLTNHTRRSRQLYMLRSRGPVLSGKHASKALSRLKRF